MSHCRVHDGLYYNYEDGCPKCRDDEERAASDRSEIIDELARSREDIANLAFYIANPGDYICPSCKYRTLKKGAPRCPRCQANPGLQYWAEVERKEQDERLRAMAVEKAAAEEWERGRKERELRACQREAERVNVIARKRRNKYIGLGVGLSVIIFIVIVPIMVSNVEHNKHKQSISNLKFTVKVLSSPSGATVLIDKKQVGITPLSITLKNGAYGIGVRKDGYESVHDMIEVKEGENREFNFNLKEE